MQGLRFMVLTTPESGLNQESQGYEQLSHCVYLPAYDQVSFNIQVVSRHASSLVQLQ
jgi:hypothetical protein